MRWDPDLLEVCSEEELEQSRILEEIYRQQCRFNGDDEETLVDDLSNVHITDVTDSDRPMQRVESGLQPVVEEPGERPTLAEFEDGRRGDPGHRRTENCSSSHGAEGDDCDPFIDPDDLQTDYGYLLRLEQLKHDHEYRMAQLYTNSTLEGQRVSHMAALEAKRMELLARHLSEEREAKLQHDKIMAEAMVRCAKEGTAQSRWNAVGSALGG